MRIKLTPAQVTVITDYLPDWVTTADIVLGASYVDIEDSDVREVLRAFEDEMSGRVGTTAPARRVHGMLADAVAALPSESDADSLAEVPEGDAPAVTVDVDTDALRAAVDEALAHVAEVESVRRAIDPEPLPLPHPLMMAAAAVARGEYGDEAKRLAEEMDDRPGERPTRWLGRLRHKLNSAHLYEAADAIRLVPDI